MTLNEVKAFRDPNCPDIVKSKLIEKTFKQSEGFIIKIVNSFQDKDKSALINEARMYIWQCFDQWVKPKNFPNQDPNKEIGHLFLSIGLKKYFIRNIVADRRYTNKKILKLKELEKNTSITDDFSFFKGNSYSKSDEEENFNYFYNSLTKRQKEIIKGIFYKKEIKEIAKNFNISCQTIRNEITRMKKNFNKIILSH